mmetsp:Transcript_14112/g.36219  ORF Transcript_14112/g.36219 Transcript_14112/m.36219 type:complete len:204 (+) Transcript_14112:411-1022(+)|eukprot:jgi/Tetstr1/447440/TSEL_003699.t1
MGDLDDLLSELSAIEKGDFGRNPSSHTAASPQRPSQPRAGGGSRGVGAARQRSRGGVPLLDELDCIEPSSGRRSGGKAPASAASPAPVQRRSSIGRAKCRMVMLGPPAARRGHYTGVGPAICCDQLRCTRCDLRVLTFPDREWARDADYMFFRNCYPDEARLGENLRARPGAAAYACQCQWTTCDETTMVDYSSELRWVCAGH